MPRQGAQTEYGKPRPHISNTCAPRKRTRLRKTEKRLESRIAEYQAKPEFTKPGSQNIRK